jgi:hypothetical protein
MTVQPSKVSKNQCRCLGLRALGPKFVSSSVPIAWVAVERTLIITSPRGGGPRRICRRGRNSGVSHGEHSLPWPGDSPAAAEAGKSEGCIPRALLARESAGNSLSPTLHPPAMLSHFCLSLCWTSPTYGKRIGGTLATCSDMKSREETPSAKPRSAEGSSRSRSNYSWLDWRRIILKCSYIQ